MKPFLHCQPPYGILFEHWMKRIMKPKFPQAELSVLSRRAEILWLGQVNLLVIVETWSLDFHWEPMLPDNNDLDIPSLVQKLLTADELCHWIIVIEKCGIPAQFKNLLSSLLEYWATHWLMNKSRPRIPHPSRRSSCKSGDREDYLLFWLYIVKPIHIVQPVCKAYLFIVLRNITSKS